jgi:hypothetical protein
VPLLFVELTAPDRDAAEVVGLKARGRVVRVELIRDFFSHRVERNGREKRARGCNREEFFFMGFSRMNVESNERLCLGLIGRFISVRDELELDDDFGGPDRDAFPIARTVIELQAD